MVRSAGLQADAEYRELRIRFRCDTDTATIVVVLVGRDGQLPVRQQASPSKVQSRDDCVHHAVTARNSGFEISLPVVGLPIGRVLTVPEIANAPHRSVRHTVFARGIVFFQRGLSGLPLTGSTDRPPLLS